MFYTKNIVTSIFQNNWMSHSSPSGLDAKQRDAIVEASYKYLDLVTASGLDILFHQLPEAFFI